MKACAHADFRAAENSSSAMNITEEKSRWDLFYLVVLSVYTASITLSVTALKDNAAWDRMLRLTRYACYLAMLVKIMNSRFSRKELFISLLLFAAGGINMFFSRSNLCIVNFIMIVAAWHMDSRRILKINLWIRSVILFVIVLLARCGVMEDFIFDASTRARHFLGFLWTTYAPSIYLFILLGYLNLRRTKMTLIEILIAEWINYRLYVLTNTRSIFYSATIVLLFAFLMRLRHKTQDTMAIRKKEVKGRERRKTSEEGFISLRYFLVAAPFVCCAIGILLHALYKPENLLFAKLNAKLSGRLQLGHAALQRYGITLFGQPIGWTGWGKTALTSEYNYVDCSYVKILADSGVVMLIIMLILYTFLMYRAVKLQDGYMQLTILVISVFCITEPRLFDPIFNPFIFLLLADLPSQKRSIEVESRTFGSSAQTGRTGGYAAMSAIK